VEIGLVPLPRVDFRLSMQRRRSGFLTACGTVALAVLWVAASGEANAARVGVLSNNYFNETAADFNAKVPGHTFTGVDVSATVPTLTTLTTNFDVLLLFEDSPFANAPAVGNVVAAFAGTGRPVVLGTFYDQDRSDASIALSPHGWGALETIDPNTTDGVGTPYAARSLNAASIVTHPLTSGVTTLTATQFAGGNQAKAGTIVLANWAQPNARGLADPAIAYRISAGACVIHIAIAPSYPTIDATHFGGDFYRAWRNAFDFGAGGCAAAAGPGAAVIPALSPVALMLSVLLLAALGGFSRRLSRRRN
jgi:hypothetical protein